MHGLISCTDWSPSSLLIPSPHSSSRFQPVWSGGRDTRAITTVSERPGNPFHTGSYETPRMSDPIGLDLTEPGPRAFQSAEHVPDWFRVTRHHCHLLPAGGCDNWLPGLQQVHSVDVKLLNNQIKGKHHICMCYYQH
ncbi:unnamed protein product [Protopolystoma xenopodis]|uniref:Uncharacterized protein n=1 Tax=Protopolystoma xenopodis TaxID=117903 RepID=A0A3S5FFQ6_9PLAT|nr:unnamed protein product [Protopolystoma xenopodis]